MLSKTKRTGWRLVTRKASSHDALVLIFPSFALLNNIPPQPRHHEVLLESQLHLGPSLALQSLDQLLTTTLYPSSFVLSHILTRSKRTDQDPGKPMQQLCNHFDSSYTFPLQVSFPRQAEVDILVWKQWQECV